MALRIVFMGTPEFSVPSLRALHEAGHGIAAVYTQPPRPAGRRGLDLVPSPVARVASELGLSVATPVSLKGADASEAFAAHDADVAVVIAYGLLLPPPILDVPRLGALNAHASLLPRWRGAAPIQRAIEAGDPETGVGIMRMEAGLDTGPVALEARLPIGPSETGGELHDRLSRAAADLFVQALAELEADRLAFETQAEMAARTGARTTYARKIEKSEARVDFAGEAPAVAGRINAFSPFPGAWTTLSVGGGKSERVKVLRAQAETGQGEPGRTLDDRLLVGCGSGAVRLLELQRAGGRPLSAADFLRGVSIPAGATLGGD